MNEMSSELPATLRTGTRPGVRRLRIPVRALSALAVAAAVAACTGGGSPSPSAPTASTGASPGPSSAPSISASPSAGASSAASAGASEPTKTTTSWGEIWDAVPPSFPLFAGSEPTTVPGEPTSGRFDVPASAKAVSDWALTALPAAGWTVGPVQGPAEDGSYTVEATGSETGCRARITAAPTGSTTVVSVDVASACPFR